MALIRKNELANMKEEQLNDRLSNLNLELIKLNAQRAIGTTLESPGKIKVIRKTIAKIYTKLTQLEKGVKEKPKEEIKMKKSEKKEKKKLNTRKEVKQKK